MITKNQELEVEISGYGSDGQGVARYNGFVIFVPFALDKEIVKIHIIKVTKNYAVGKLIEIIKPSNERVKPVCPYFSKCGGCNNQNLCYNAQLVLKKQIVSDAISKIGGFDDVVVSQTVSSDNEYFYRNKSAFPIEVDKNGVLQVGMFKTLSHNMVYIDECQITDNQNMKIAKAFKEIVNTFSNQTKHFFKHLVIRTIDGKSLITVVSSKHIKNAKIIFEALKNKLEINEESIGLYECLKTSDNNVILDGKIVHLFGIEKISADILGIKVSVSPLSFFQINLSVMKKIYEKVNKLVSSKIVVDAYSGAGLMSAILSKTAKEVYGIEIVEDATKDANMLKEINNIENLVNINGDVSVILPQLATKLSDYTLVLDPPRKGVDQKVISCISESLPNNIVYVSCNPATLARDLKEICKSGYQIKMVEPFDMFPQTSNVETLAYLVRN